MSTHTQAVRKTTSKISAMKQQRKIVSLTAYSTPMAKLLDDIVDLIIVGDSTGMVVYGLNSTLNVSLETMINHGSAVVRGTQQACVVVDMPFSTYQESLQQAYRNAAMVLAKTEAQAIKMEGGFELVETVSYLVQRGIPVLPHIGLTPQHVNTLGGFKAQGRTEEAAKQLVDLACAFEQAGAFALLIEGVFEATASAVTDAVNIPTIGIGASPKCDGQVLVTDDLLGLFMDYTPKFVRHYAELSPIIRDAVSAYRDDVIAGNFPEDKHCFGVKQK